MSHPVTVDSLSRRERLSAHGGEHVLREAQLLMRVDAASIPAQPFAVNQASASQREL